MGCVEGEGTPITSCRASDKFAFIELRTPAETANCLHLNGIQVPTSYLMSFSTACSFNFYSPLHYKFWVLRYY